MIYSLNKDNSLILRCLLLWINVDIKKLDTTLFALAFMQAVGIGKEGSVGSVSLYFSKMYSLVYFFPLYPALETMVSSMSRGLTAG